jgi:hypothetical protein
MWGESLDWQGVKQEIGQNYLQRSGGEYPSLWRFATPRRTAGFHRPKVGTSIARPLLLVVILRMTKEARG